MGATLQVRRPDLVRRIGRLASELGVSKTEVIERAINELDRTTGPHEDNERLWRIAQAFAALPDHDTRSPDEMLYDADGLPK